MSNIMSVQLTLFTNLRDTLALLINQENPSPIEMYLSHILNTHMASVNPQSSDMSIHLSHIELASIYTHTYNLYCDHIQGAQILKKVLAVLHHHQPMAFFKCIDKLQQLDLLSQNHFNNIGIFFCIFTH